jgi:hypothetical protein
MLLRHRVLVGSAAAARYDAWWRARGCVHPEGSTIVPIKRTLGGPVVATATADEAAFLLELAQETQYTRVRTVSWTGGQSLPTIKEEFSVVARPRLPKGSLEYAW